MLALLGFVGNGPFSDATARSPDRSVAVDYKRFVHRGSPVSLDVAIGAGGGEIAIIDESYLDGFEPSEVMEKARQLQGLERLDQIKYAVLERSGGISIVPKQSWARAATVSKPRAQDKPVVRDRAPATGRSTATSCACVSTRSATC